MPMHFKNVQLLSILETFVATRWLHAFRLGSQLPSKGVKAVHLIWLLSLLQSSYVIFEDSQALPPHKPNLGRSLEVRS